MSSFKAEMIAINSALSICVERIFMNKHFNILTDSYSALESLKNRQSKSKLVQSICHQLTVLETRSVTVEFTWIPAHTDMTSIHIQGNDEANRLTRDPNAKLTK